MAKDYAKVLKKKGKERVRLTEQLQDLCFDAATEIAAVADLGTEVEVDGVAYRTHEYRSNIGSFRTVVVSYPESEYRHMCYRAIDNEEPGSEYYLRRDFNSVVVVADRDEFLHFANHLPEIIQAFSADQDKIIDALRSAFDKLRAMAE